MPWLKMADMSLHDLVPHINSLQSHSISTYLTIVTGYPPSQPPSDETAEEPPENTASGSKVPPPSDLIMPRHELFLTAIIASDDVEESLKVLQGYCEMAPVNIITHNVFWEGPRARKPKAVDPNFIKQQTPPKDALWKLLSDQLSRQSYILTTSYEVEKEEFGKVEDAQVEESKGSELEYVFLSNYDFNC